MRIVPGISVIFVKECEKGMLKVNVKKKIMITCSIMTKSGRTEANLNLEVYATI